MKRVVIFFIFLIFLAVVSITYAHPPSDIKITFNPDTKMLTAIIMHNTSNPDKHCINKVDVGLDGKQIIEHFISREDNNESQTVVYLIPDAKDNDVISVGGPCSISGELQKEITIKLEK
ncbi:MAG: hypothetical protein NTZ48_03860 [Candidatus Omnitrophica bacterium]|nr:hypothetical protein [Candidatus Omnitrophota bacterium]